MALWAIWLVLLLTVLTQWIFFDPHVRFGYDSPEGRVASETVIVLAGTAVILLSLGRFLLSGLILDAAIASAFAVVTVANAVQGIALPIAGADPGEWMDESIAVLSASRLAALLALCGAVILARDRTVDESGRWRAISITACYSLLLVLVVHVLSYTLSSELPAFLTPTGRAIIVSGQNVRGAFLDVTSLTVAIQLSLAGLSALTCVLFVLAHGGPNARFHRWVGVALVFATFSQLHYAAYPSFSSDIITTGDLLRLAFYGVLLFAISAEYQRHQRSAGELLVLEERTRIASDIHDGAAQGVSYVASSLANALRGGRPPTLDDLRRWRDSLLEAQTNLRDAVLILGRRSPSIDVAQMLEDFCHHFSKRFSIPVDFRLEGSPPPALSPTADRELIFLVSEVLHNVRKHAPGRRANVCLLGERDRFVLRISNGNDGHDGSQDYCTEESTEFGLRSMASRAKRLHGSLAVTPGNGAGLTVELVVPIRP